MKRAFAILIYLFSALASADPLSEGWSYTTTCPPSGATYPAGAFSSNTQSGFSASGTCSRTDTHFTKLQFTASAGGTLNASTIYGLHTGDVFIFPPPRTTDTDPVFTVDPGCPWVATPLNWIYVQWASSAYATLGNGIAGVGSYSPTSGVKKTLGYDASSALVDSTVSTWTGSCSSGTYTLTGSGDHGGKMYFTRLGAGVYKTNSGRAILYLPRTSIDTTADFGSQSFAGLQFDGFSTSDTAPVQVTGDATGTTFTIKPYSDPGAGTFSASYTDTLVVTAANSPSNGMFYGTLTRTGTGAGSGAVICIVGKGAATRVVCSGQLPSNNSYPLSIAFTSDPFEVLGQPNPSTQLAVQAGMDGPSSVYSDGTHLFVADTTNHRVLIWKTMPTGNNQAPDVVLGQPTFSYHLSNAGGLSASSLSYPEQVYYDGTHFFVADAGNNRVLIWNSLPLTNQQAADVVIGQPNLTSNGSGTSSTVMDYPAGVYSDGTKLYVSDQNNSRILIYSSIPSSNGAAASFVLGQGTGSTRFTAKTTGTSSTKFDHPYRLSGDGTRLAVADTNNNRVLIWSALPTANATAANVSLGQTSLSAKAAPNPPTQKSLRAPRGVFLTTSYTYVPDTDNNRVMVWANASAATNTNATFNVGTSGWTSNSANNGGASASTMYLPDCVFADGTRLFVCDEYNGRVLIWNTAPTSSGVAADLLLGHDTFSFDPSQHSEIANFNLGNPDTVQGDGTHLVVSDPGYKRVLIWNTLPTKNKQAADLVLGQPDLTSQAGGGTGAQSISYPSGLYSDGTHLLVSDLSNNRVLIWNTFPTSSNQAADIVLGQPDKDTTNNLAAANNTMFHPSGVASDGTHVFVSDGNYNRILVWNTFPTVDNQPADIVLGQADFASSDTNRGGTPDANTLNAPEGIQFGNGKLIVADWGNSRVLIWNTLPTTTGQAADVELGHADFTSYNGNDNGLTAHSLDNPANVFFDGVRLFVADESNHRILGWNSIPHTNGKDADLVFGQPDFTSNSAGLSNQMLNGPNAVYVKNKTMYVLDSGNARVMVFHTP